ncbi:MBL fold metallo-hydrolase [Anaerococcus sp. Marseille-Q5996]|uniref:MBL fold metallo-hydrolase n=1 Tax=Anaerococcus sp. Marseille-Q5996 TaxID=2972769 RepID=UPI0021C9F578|nr:MBL fold metallo-hydrolase [Anaerococcus sp. Marseille-Q5996]
MEIMRFPLGPVLTNLYVVSENGHGFIVDAVIKNDLVTKYIKDNNIIIDSILQTHTHFDHVLGLEYYKNLYNVDVFASSESRDIANDKYYNLAYDYDDLNVPIDNFLTDNEIFTDFKIKALKTPGHSLDSISYLIGDYLFSGDTLFRGNIGRTDFPGGDYETLIDSINEKYRVLNQNIVVYPGHGEQTSLDYEFNNNPFLI